MCVCVLGFGLFEAEVEVGEYAMPLMMPGMRGMVILINDFVRN